MPRTSSILEVQNLITEVRWFLPRAQVALDEAQAAQEAGEQAAHHTRWLLSADRCASGETLIREHLDMRQGHRIAAPMDDRELRQVTRLVERLPWLLRAAEQLALESDDWARLLPRLRAAAAGSRPAAL